MYGSLFVLILAFLTFGHKAVTVLAGPFLRPNYLRYAQNFPIGSKTHFPNEKHIYPNSLINS